MITAKVKTLKEILEIEEVEEYTEVNIYFKNTVPWNISMNKLIGKTIEISKTVNEDKYHYKNTWVFKKSWLTDIKEEIDWSKVPVDTKILVRDGEKEEFRRRYFSKYENGKIYAWESGRTSWNSDVDEVTCWEYAKVSEDSGVK